ncbi:MAG: transcription elongation factor GreA, partial [Candidatus Ventricola sp.]
MADSKRLVVTREGLQKMKEELEYKETTEKMRIAEQLKVAISYGDLSENAEYDAAKNDQAALEQRINELKAMIENAVVVDESKINTDAVNFGTRVTIVDLDDEDGEEEVYTIV